jgi:hypothetical protein
MEEALSDDPLELRDLLAHGGLRVAQLARRATERTGARHRFQSGEMPQLDSQPIISAHDRYKR